MTKKQHYDAERYLAHRKAFLKYQKQYRAENPKKVAKKQAEYRATHRFELSKKKRNYYLAHRKEIAKRAYEHRAAHQVEYAWRNMHDRAENKDGYHPSYTHVKVCRRWSGSKGKAHFVADMGQPPKGTSLSRFGDIGNYTPSNCAWHTRAQQLAEATKKRNQQR